MWFANQLTFLVDSISNSLIYYFATILHLEAIFKSQHYTYKLKGLAYLQYFSNWNFFLF